MALGSMVELKALLSISDSDTSQDTALASALRASEAAVESYCKRQFSLAVRTEYYDGTGTPEMLLRCRPVVAPRLYGTFAAGATTISGISGTAIPGNSGTAMLVPGMPVVHDSLPAGTAVVSVDSPTTVTISQPATAAAVARPVQFGLEAYFDPGGSHGDAPDSFPAAGRLTLGVDFALRRDRPDGLSKSGILARLGGSRNLAMAGWSDWGFPGAVGRGTLTARRAPCWPERWGCLKVTYTAGYSHDGAPADLRQAIQQLAVMTWKLAPLGGAMLTSEGYEGYSYSLGLLRESPELHETRSLLRAYREVIV